MEKTRRNPYWDNVRSLMIFFVVLGHVILPVTGKGRSLSSVYNWIYIFHMPVFVFVSGRFSRSYVHKDGKTQRLTGYLLTYLVFTICLRAVQFIFRGTIPWSSILYTSQAPWYMLAMFFWLRIIPYFARYKAVPMIILSLMVALYAGTYDSCGLFLSISRIIVFFPFFLAGFHCKDEWFKDRSMLVKAVACAVIVISFLCVALNVGGISEYLTITTGSTSYSKLGFSDPLGVVIRLAWYAIAALLGAAFLIVVPGRRLVTTYIGERTLGIYVVHRIIRGVLDYGGAYKYLGSGKQLLLACILISAVITLFASARVFTDALQLLFKTTFFLKEKPEDADPDPDEIAE